jgi:hypothetical protein
MNIIGLGGINKRIDDENFDSLEDAIANREFGMDYKQLGKNEKEWVRDEMDIIGLGGIGAIKKQKIASSPTLANLEKMLNQYFYSTTYQILPDLTVINSKGVYGGVIIKKEKSRYVIYQNK